MSQVSTGNVIEKPNYTHEAMIDLIVQQPMITQGEIARHFGYTQGWVSQILRSDALRELLAARKVQVLGPLFAEAEKRFEALAHRSIDVLMDQLDTKGSADVALKALDITSRAMGYGAKQAGVQLTQNFVVAMPPKSDNGDRWMEQHAPRLSMPAFSLDTVIDVPL